MQGLRHPGESRTQSDHGAPVPLPHLGVRRAGGCLRWLPPWYAGNHWRDAFQCSATPDSALVAHCIFRPRSSTSTFGHRPQDPVARGRCQHHITRALTPPLAGAHLGVPRLNLSTFQGRVDLCPRTSFSVTPVDLLNVVAVSRKPATLWPARYARLGLGVFTPRPVSFVLPACCADTWSGA